MPELLERLAPLLQQRKDRKAGYEELIGLSSYFPSDVQYTWHLLNFAFELGNKEDALKYEKQLRELEGPDGSLWRFAKARRMVAESRDVHDDSFVEAAQLLSQLQGLRPTWLPVYMLGADIAQRQGNTRLAAEQLTRAVDLGAAAQYRAELDFLALPARPDRRRRAIARQAGRDGQHLGRDRSVRHGDRHVAGRPRLRSGVRLAEDGVKSRPDDATAYWWLGRVMLAAKRPKDAEAAYKNAVRKGPQEVRTWLTLISFYSQLGDSEKARETVKRMEQFLKLAGAQQAFVWAQAHEIAGDMAVPAGTTWRPPTPPATTRTSRCGWPSSSRPGIRPSPRNACGACWKSRRRPRMPAMAWP